MNTEIVMQQGFAVLVIRVIAGVLFFFQAYDKIFRIGLHKVSGTFAQSFPVPPGILYISTMISSILELVAGLLLIIGLFPVAAAILLALDLAIVSAAFSFIRPMWDMQYVFPRLVLVIGYLLLPKEWDIYSLENIMR